MGPFHFDSLRLLSTNLATSWCWIARPN